MTGSATVSETMIKVVTGSTSGPAARRRFPSDCDTLWRWIHDYVSEPHNQLGRGGPVCPFVPPALRDGVLSFSMRYDVEGNESVVSTLRAEMDGFDIDTPALSYTGIQLHGRLVAYPLLETEGWAVLDADYSNMKDVAVRSGLMIGQFHPDCDERAVRNHAFQVSRAPYAVVAMRRMAPHDILFLQGNAEWFDHYRSRFGSYVDSGRLRDPAMRRAYAAALAGARCQERRTRW